MLHRGLAMAGMAAALAAFLWAGASQGSDTMPLTLKGGTAPTGFSGGADIMTLKLDQGADTVAVRGGYHHRHHHHHSHHHGHYYGGYYRPYYYGNYYPSYFYPRYSSYYYYPRYSSYYYPRYYSYYPRYFYPGYSFSFGYYQPYSYDYASPLSYADPYFYYPMRGGLNVMPHTSTLQTHPLETGQETLPSPRRLDEDGTYPYDGGPVNPAPMPRAEPGPSAAPAAPAAPPPADGRVVSVPKKTAKYSYRAYGEPPQDTPRGERSYLTGR